MIAGRRRAREDDGSALVIALISIGAWAIVIFAILVFVETGFNLAAGTADQRDETYAADGAADAAIVFTRSYLEGGGDPADCPSLRFVEREALGDVDVTIHDVAVQVECEGVEVTLVWPSPYDMWVHGSDVIGPWLDDPGDDPADGEDPLIFDGGDIRILLDGDLQYGDVNGSGAFEDGEPVEAPQFDSGGLAVTATICRFPGYETWGRFNDGSGEWLDDPGDDAADGEDPLIFDGGDIRILYDTPTSAFFADVDGSADLSPGDAVQECEPALVAHARLESAGGDPEVSIEQWRVIR